MRRLLALSMLVSVAGGAGAATKVTFRDDHTVLVDGKPFFPVGLYYCAEEFDDKSDRLLTNLRDLGFNTLGYYRWGSPGWRQELERAGRLGFKVWIRGHNGFDLTSAEVERAAAEQVRQARGS